MSAGEQSHLLVMGRRRMRPSAEVPAQAERKVEEEVEKEETEESAKVLEATMVQEKQRL